MDGWTNGWTNGWMEEWMDDNNLALIHSSNTIQDRHLLGKRNDPTYLQFWDDGSCSPAML